MADSILLVGLKPLGDQSIRAHLTIDGSQIHTLDSLGLEMGDVSQFFQECDGIMAITDPRIESHMAQVTRENKWAVIVVDAKSEGQYQIARMVKVPIHG